MITGGIYSKHDEIDLLLIYFHTNCENMVVWNNTKSQNNIFLFR